MADWVDLFKEKSQEKMPHVPQDDWEVMSRLIDRHVRRKAIMRWSLSAIPLAATVLAIVLLANKDETETSTLPERMIAETLIADTDFIETNIAEPSLGATSALRKPETVAIVNDAVTIIIRPPKDTSSVIAETNDDVYSTEPIEPLVVDDKNQRWLETPISHPMRRGITRVDLSSSLMLLLQKAGGQVLSNSGVSYLSSYSLSNDNKQGFDNPHLPELPKPIKIEHSHPYTVGLLLSYPLSNKFSISTGLDYSICDSRITYSDKSLVNQSAHYLGVPLRLDWIPLRTSKFFLYTGTGAEAYRCLFAKQSQDTRLKDTGIYYSAIIVGGLRYEPVRSVGFFIEPQFSYNFLREDPAVLSAITDTKVLFNLKAGISFSFGR